MIGKTKHNMKLPFHLVTDYVHNWKANLAQEAFNQFFKPTGFPTKKQETEAFPLFSEWLIFDYRLPSGVTFIAEYYLKNPDKLQKSVLDQLAQVISSQWYGGFQLGRRKRGEWFEGEHLFSGKTLKIYDKIGSSNLPDQGMIIGRVAKINEHWGLVGASPLYIPQTFTERMRRIMRNNSSPYRSPQDAWILLQKHGEKTPLPPKMTKIEIEKKRQDLGSLYKRLTKNISGCISFEQLIRKIYEEDGRPPLDVWELIMKAGLPKKLFFEQTELFNDIWNYFPHKILNDNCPTELFNRLSRKKNK